MSFFSMCIQVDIALECARLQHRFMLPQLEVQDFSQVGHVEAKMMPHHQSTFINHDNNPNHQPDIVQEILSVAQASQDLINHDAWGGGGGYAPTADDFSFLPHNANQFQDMGNFRFMDQLRDDQNGRNIEIADFADEFKPDRMVENLRWVGMSDKDLEKVINISSGWQSYH